MASVRKRKWIHNGVESEAWVVNYTDNDGKRRLKTFDKKKAADEFRTTVEVEVRDGVHTAASASVTFAEAAKAFIEDSARRQKRGEIVGGTLHNYERYLNHFLPARFGRMKLSEMEAHHFQAAVDELGDKYAPNTVRAVFGAINTMMMFAARKPRRWVKRNILLDEPVKLPRRTKRTSIPSRDDVLKLLEVTSRIEDGQHILTCLNRRATVVLGIFAGMRPGEIYGLQWENVDLERMVIRVRHSQSVIDGLKGPKSEAGNRDIPLSAPIYAALEQLAIYWTMRDQFLCDEKMVGSKPHEQRLRRAYHAQGSTPVTVPPRTGYVLKNWRHEPMKSSNNRFFGAVMKLAGLQDETGKNQFTPHALRHAAVSMLLQQRVPLPDIARFVGHRHTSTTVDVYGHIMDDENRMSEAITQMVSTVDATRERQLAVTT